MPEAFRYKAFISYSHGADRVFAAALQHALHRFAKPWYRLRAMRTFRDSTSLSADHDLWDAIRDSLLSSEWLLYFASPEAAASPWVARELTEWCAQRETERLLIVWTGGTIAWNGASGDFDWERTTAIPAQLSGAFRAEPLFIDCRACKRAPKPTRHPDFRGHVATIAARLHGRDKDELHGDDLRQHRRVRTLVALVVVLLLALTLAAFRFAAAAEDQRRTAVSRELAAHARAVLDRDPSLSVLLACEGARSRATEEAEAALRRALLSPQAELVIGPADGRVRRAALGADGRWVAVSTEDGRVRVLERSTGRESFALQAGPDAPRIAFGGLQGKTLLVAARAGGTRLVDAESGSVRRTLQHPGRLHGARWSDGGRTVLTWGRKPQLVLWDARTGSRLAQLRTPSPPVTDADTIEQPRIVAAASLEMSAGLWSIAEGEPRPRRRSFARASQPIAVIRLGAGGKRAVTDGEPGQASVWDVATGGRVALCRHAARIASIRFDPAGARFVTAGEDRTARIWNATDGSAVSVFFGHRDAVETASFDPTGRYVVSAGKDGTARVWLADSAQEIAVLRGHSGNVLTARFGSGSERVLTVGEDGTARVWSWRLGSDKMPLRAFAAPGPVDRIGFAEDGGVIEAADGLLLRRWDARTGESRPVPANGPPRERPQYWFVVGKDGMRVEDPRTGKVLEHLDALLRGATHARRHSTLLAVGGATGPVRIARFATGDVLATMSGEPAALRSLSFSSGGRHLLGVDVEGRGHLWAVVDGRLQARLEGLSHEVGPIVVDPKRQRLLAVRNPYEGKSIQPGSATLWDLASGRRICELRGHTAGILSAAFDSSGRWILTGARDGTARVWGAADGREWIRLHGSRADVKKVAFRSDSVVVVTHGADERMRVYDVPELAGLDGLLELAKRRVRRDLTAAERDRYLEGR